VLVANADGHRQDQDQPAARVRHVDSMARSL
jgi:hypothetical protein